MLDPRVFRTYDIRALVNELVDESSEYFGIAGTPESFQASMEPDGVEQIGRGLAHFLGEQTVAVGADTRLSSSAWKAALMAGLASQGVDVWDLGLTSTDLVYYASGKYNVPAVQITASHCTKELNGMKIVRAGAKVVGMGQGMEELRDICMADNSQHSGSMGDITPRDMLEEYIDHLMQFVDVDAIKPFRICGDAGNGVGGVVAEKLIARIPQISLTKMYFEPDGRFPNHEANPFETENIHELIARVPAEGFDFGVAWDGDADRVYFLDEKGGYIHGDFITTLIARYFLGKTPGAAIVYDLRSSWSVKDWITREGGKPIPERVGHSFIKATMRRENAIFGGEVSGHYYFREHWYADNGYIPLLAVLTMLSREGVKMSELVASLGEYFVSGEVNSKVSNTEAVVKAIASKYSDAKISYKDGISVDYPDWHFNVRPSANDPLVRLNLEARTELAMISHRDELLSLIRTV